VVHIHAYTLTDLHIVPYLYPLRALPDQRQHPDTLMMMNNLAITLRERGELAEAEAMGREVLAAMREVQGARHPDTLTTMGNLASTLRKQAAAVGTTVAARPHGTRAAVPSRPSLAPAPPGAAPQPAPRRSALASALA